MSLEGPRFRANVCHWRRRARSDGEAFGDPYELPTPRVRRKLRGIAHDVELAHAGATGEAKYADVIERALYNGVNSGCL